MDLRPRSDGAVALARWLVETSSGNVQVLPTYVFQHHLLPRHLLYESGPDRINRVLELVRNKLREGGPVDVFEDVAAFEAADAAQALLRQSSYFGAAFLVVGRRGLTSPAATIALGRVTTHLLAQPDITVIVAPPRLVKGIGKGPVVVATDLSATSHRAATFALALATSLGRAVHVVHVSAQRDPSEVATWAASAGLPPTDAVVEPGADVVEALSQYAVRRDACLLTCGLRVGGRIDRLLAGGHARALAARGPIPVAVVPA